MLRVLELLELKILKVCFRCRDALELLARAAFVILNRRAIATMFVCLSETGVYCDYTVHGANLSLWLNSPMSWAP